MVRFRPAPELLDSPLGRQLGPPPALGQTAQAPEVRRVPTQARIVIVGAGPAAVSLLTQLWHSSGLADVIVLDPFERPMHRFFERVTALEQRVLRSPYEHHVGAHNSRDCELLDFARSQWRHLTEVERGEVRMAQSGQRSVVPLDVFRAYAQHVVANHALTAVVHRAAVRSVVRNASGWTVHHDRGSTDTCRVVMATGEESRALPTAWGGHESSRVRRWDAPRDRPTEHTAVVGSGLSAAHAVTAALAAGAVVTWIQRTTERYQCADVNARYFRAQGRGAYTRCGLPQRLRILRRERRPSIMLEFEPTLRAAEADGRLDVRRGRQVTDVRDRADLTLRLDDGATVPGVDELVGAIGTVPTPIPLEGGDINRLGGLPVLDDDTLQVHGCPGLHAIGALAGLSLGPAARNIDGMRVAAGRIDHAFKTGTG